MEISKYGVQFIKLREGKEMEIVEKAIISASLVALVGLVVQVVIHIACRKYHKYNDEVVKKYHMGFIGDSDDANNR